MNLYIADLHFGHKSAIDFDHRPFADVEEMDQALIQLWNSKVSAEDHIYILGDFAYRSQKPEEWYLSRLLGRKHLVIGNHDYKLLKNDAAMAYFDSVDKMMHVADNGSQICLCHFPIIDWNGMYRGSWHIYGHIHNASNASASYMKKLERALNASACINHYVPCGFEELKANNAKWKEGGSTDGCTV